MNKNLVPIITSQAIPTDQLPELEYRNGKIRIKPNFEKKFFLEQEGEEYLIYSTHHDFKQEVCTFKMMLPPTEENDEGVEEMPDMGRLVAAGFVLAVGIFVNLLGRAHEASKPRSRPRPATRRNLPPAMVGPDRPNGGQNITINHHHHYHFNNDF